MITKFLKNFKEKLDNFIDKVGVDKMLHFLVGGWLTTIGLILGLKGGLIALFILLLVSIVKEKYMDNEFTKDDIKAALIGSGASFIIYFILLLF